MMIFGWKRYLPSHPEELYQWVPRFEQVEMFGPLETNDCELDSAEPDRYLDSGVSVSALVEVEDASITEGGLSLWQSPQERW